MSKNLIHILREKCNVAPKMIWDSQSMVTFLNPYSYKLARKNTELFDQFDVIYVDGISLVMLLKLFGIPCERYSFDMTSLAKDLFTICNNQNKKIFFIGSKQEEIEKSVKHFSEKYPNMNILGYRNGYFNHPSERTESIQEIIELNPDFVVAGMGTPYQEEFLFDLKKAGYKGLGFTCGGFLHQSSIGVNYYPAFFDKFNLRWLYRIWDEPKLLKRYVFEYPYSAVLFLYDYFR